MCVKCETGNVGPKDKENRVSLGGIMKLVQAIGGSEIPLPETVGDMPRYFDEAGKVLDVLAEHTDTRNILAYALMVTNELMSHVQVEEIAEEPLGKMVLGGIAAFGQKVANAVALSGAFSGESKETMPVHSTVH